MHVRLIDHTEEKYKGIEATMSALTVYFSPRRGEGRGGKGDDDKAGEMMGCRCPSHQPLKMNNSDVDKETCSAQDHEGISSFILHLP